jgi:surfactin synthase thioesterase subunit
MPAPKLACPFTVFGGIADKGIPFEALSAWDQHTASGSKLIPVPGAHFFLHEHRAKLIRQITEDLGLPEA